MKMRAEKFWYLITILLCSTVLKSQIPINSIPELQSVIVREVTSVYNTHTFAISDPVMTQRLGPALSSSNDFGGVPAAENYDIFISDADGTLNANGSYITIECRFLGTSGGGGGNIAHLQLEFTNGYKISPSVLSSYYVSGGNYIPGSELNAVDCNPNTFTTLGNNSATPNTMFLRLTFDFSNIIDEVNLTACEGEGFEYAAGGYVFNENNPSGNAYINTPNGCNRIEIVDINFEPRVEAQYTYSGCSGDMFSIMIGNTIFNEQNPSGTVSVPALVGCDTLYEVNLTFDPLIEASFNYTGCTGDQFFIDIGGTRFDEQNPSGTAIVAALTGCDTLYQVNLTFEPLIEAYFSYIGCEGDQFSVTIGGVTFNEQNSFGTAIVEALTGCDTLYEVDLIFEPYEIETYNYIGCVGDQFSLTIGGVTFDEQNPSGTALVVTSVGCDTLYNVNLNFEPLETKNYTYEGCTGDQFSVTIGGITFNELNPSGTALVTALFGCDTIYSVSLLFQPLIEASFSYTGCSEDGFSITLGGTTFDESNPSGTAIVNALNGCDTIYTVELTFEPFSTQGYFYTGCAGDPFEVTIGGITFNEQNPTGSAYVDNINGCDTLYNVELLFEPLESRNFTYSGCTGDGFVIQIGGTVFNEQNPSGVSIAPASIGCDTLYNVNLSFEPLQSKTFNYAGCDGDGFSITLGGTTFNQNNPVGTALVPGTTGCDTLYNVNLVFGQYTVKSFNYTGCTGNQYTVIIGGQTFNEQNPTGNALVSGASGCDTLYNVSLVFNAPMNKTFNRTGCTGDGFSVTIGGITFNEQNPMGTANVQAPAGCDTIYDVSLVFNQLPQKNFLFQSCSGSQFAVTFGNTTFNEQNPTGIATISGGLNCDTLVNVNLTFAPYVIKDLIQTACVGSQYTITLGGITFDESNPSGTAIVQNALGCDTLYNINLSFVPLIEKDFLYSTCSGSGYSITIGNQIFDETNPAGNAVVVGSGSCDTIYRVKLTFEDQPEKNISYNTCKGSSFSITIAGVTFNEQNPNGTVMVPAPNGCDTVYFVDLVFTDLPEKNFSYSACKGDGYSVSIGGVIFNEQNPAGTAIVSGNLNCDTIVNVNLVFNDIISRSFKYEGCNNDQFSINLGGTVFNEQNPTGSAMVAGTTGCDTLVTVELIFSQNPDKKLVYNGCIGDQYEVNLGGQIFNELNPTGVAYVPATVGCDTIYTVELSFTPPPSKEFKYKGCKGDQFFVNLGGQTFNELKPIGIVNVPGLSGCDTVYNVQLEFLAIPTNEFRYTGCAGDQFEVLIGGQKFNEQNPIGTAVSPANQGCDTIYNVSLVFEALPVVNLEFTKCESENFEIVIGDQTFSQQRPEGIVIVPSVLGCDTLYQVKIRYEACPDECKLSFPNIFSTQIAAQSQFLIEASEGCILSNIRLRIFDRWGNLMYTANNNLWDGTFNGKLCEEGVYTFLFEYMINDQAYKKSGDITLLR